MTTESPTPDGPRIVPPDGGREITVMGARVRYLLPADAPAPGPFSVVEWTVPAFYTAPPTLHHHLEDDWAAVVLEGSVTFVFKAGPKVAESGSLVWCPHGSPFAWRMTVISALGSCSFTPQEDLRNSSPNSPALCQRLVRRE